MWLNLFKFVSRQLDWFNVRLLDKRHEADRVLLDMMNAAKGHVVILALVNLVTIASHANRLIVCQVSGLSADNTFTETEAEPLARIVVWYHVPRLRLEWHIVAEAKL